MDYGKIIKRSLNIIWQHKVLWVFGILAVLFGADGGFRGGSPGMRYSLNRGDLERWRQGLPWTPGLPFDFWRPGRGVPAAPDWVPIVLGILGVLLIVGLLLFIISVIVRYTSVGALIGMVNEVEQQEATGLGSGLRQGWARFLRLFAMDLIVGVVTFLAVLAILLILALIMGLIVVLPAILLANANQGSPLPAILWGLGLGLIFLLLTIIVFVALGALVSLIREFAFRASIINRRGIFDALSDAIALVRTQFRSAVMMWLLLLAINLAVALVTIPLALLGVGSLLIPGLFVFGITESPPVAILAALPFLLFLFLVALFFGGIYYSFRSTVWTLTYRELEAIPVMEQA